MIYKTVEFKMPESLRSVVYGLTEKAGDILYEEMLFAGREKLPGFE